jgi:XTP/dITP diphosphohydrolase
VDILIATKNSYKVDEILFYLEGVERANVHLLKDQEIDVKVEENGKTLEENAQKKAIEISKKTKYFTLASDGGVDIPALGKDWDFLKNQRIVGEEKNDVQKAKKLLEMTEDLKGEDRKVQFHHALALAKDGKLLWSNEKITESGYIATQLPDENIPKGKWLSHLWYYPEFKKVFNKLNKSELKKVREQSKELRESLQIFLLTITFFSKL